VKVTLSGTPALRQAQGERVKVKLDSRECDCPGGTTPTDRIVLSFLGTVAAPVANDVCALRAKRHFHTNSYVKYTPIQKNHHSTSFQISGCISSASEPMSAKMLAASVR